ncbi:MAG: sigma-70 family RNA polymerase sigma factor [Acidobacteriota bacterium]
MDEEIRALLAGKRHREAFELLLSAYQNKVFRLACGMLGNEALAEETAQDVFVRIWKALSGYRGEASLSTWIYAIARNTCLTAIRRGASREEVSLDDPAAQAAAAHREENRGEVFAELARLPEKYRQVLTLFYMEEKSYEEVARLLDLPMGTVKSHIHRARKQLAQQLLASGYPPRQLAARTGRAPLDTASGH